jgi:hypothetical protein
MPLSEFKGKQSFELNGKTFATQDNLEEDPIFKKIIIDKASGFIPSSQSFNVINDTNASLFKTLDLSPAIGKNEAFVLFSVFSDAEETGTHAISVRPAGAEESTNPITRKGGSDELVGGCSTIYLGGGGKGGNVSTATNKYGQIEFYMPRLKINISMIGYIPMIE